MATVAAIFRRPQAGAALREFPQAGEWAQQYDPYQLRPLPCEDVYFFCKRIDNSRVVREADPAALKRCRRAVSMSLLSAIVLMLLMLADALGLIAGYQIHSLEKNQEKLARENAMLELDEARLLSPERLQQLAGQLQLVDPDPTRVVYLNPPTDGSLALNMHLRQRGL